MMGQTIRGGMILLLMAAGAARVHALPRLATGQDLTLREAEAFPDVLLAVTEKADLKGSCHNDLFLVASGTADLSGRFDNDVWALADTVRFSGRAADHLRVAAKTLELDGEVSNTVSLAGGTVRIGPNAVLHNGLTVTAEDVFLSGLVEGDVRIRAARVTLSGCVTGEVDLDAADMVALAGTRIEGDLVYTAEQDWTLDPGVTVSGRISRRAPAAGSTAADRLPFALAGMLSALVAGLPFVLFFSRAVGAAIRRLRTGFGICLLTGGVCLPLIPILAALVAATGIGLPLAGLLVGGGAILFYLGHIVTAVWVGSLLLGRRGPQPMTRVFPVLAVGLLVGYSLWLVPAVAVLIGLAASLAGAGALLAVATGRSGTPPAINLVEPKTEKGPA